MLGMRVVVAQPGIQVETKQQVHRVLEQVTQVVAATVVVVVAVGIHLVVLPAQVEETIAEMVTVARADNVMYMVV
jgi:hypothetical protein